ncbi:MAG: serine/threonine protein kinase [Gemmatimonadetes bacterium]|nr:serine/threonine protein kinase [Gemmatimonadota bacterium]
MDAARWQQIQDVFLDALELSPAERAPFLDGACGADAELRREVESLLDAGATADPLLDATLDDLVLLVEEDPARGPSAPERAGPYAVLEELGRGGMGIVYRARRADGQYEREVALKIVHVAGDSVEVARRFRQERQILASLEHPSIARLYDAGATADGRPFLAMELVRGEPIHHHADRLRMSVDARLRLFEQVVAAVDFAHRKLVIHRDLKPSNVLVSEQGEVKLLDFGIAKLLEADSTETTRDEPVTRADQRLLTPEYASPEQQRGEPLSTASDVYSLGIMLHQLLVGTRPTGPGLPAPSTVQDTASAADVRGTTAARLRRQLKGELDTIVLKALRPEPDARYPSAAALLDDLVRYRTGLPLSARPPSWAYRARKFVGRNRLAVAAATAAMLGLLGGLTAAVHQARIARQERDLAQSVSGFLVNLFSSANPLQASPERLDTLRINAFLARAVDRLDTDLGSQPELRARMQLLLGSVHEGLGLYEPAQSLLTAALEGYRTLEGDDGAEVAAALGELGKTLHSAGRFGEAEQRYREALERTRERLGERSPELARLRTQYAGLLLSQDRLPQAESVLVSALDVRRDLLAERSIPMASDLNLLAALQYRQGRVEESVGTMVQAHDMMRDLVGANHATTAVFAQNLGLVLYRLERNEEAEPLLREAITGMRAALGPDHPNVGPALKTLANVVNALGRWDEADSLFVEALAFSRRVMGPVHPDVSTTLHDHGGNLMQRGELERALPLLEEAVRVEADLGDVGAGLGITMGTLAEARRRTGDAQAVATYLEALEILEGAFPPGHPRILVARNGWALAVADAGRREEAETVLLDNYDGAVQIPDGGQAARLTARALADFYESVGDTEEAERWSALAELPDA